MGQYLFIKISRRDDLECRQLHLKLFELCGDDALSYSEVCYWSRQFLMGWKYVEDPRRTLRPPGFSVQLRIQSALEEMTLASTRCIAEARHASATIVFYILTGVLGPRFGYW
jgi:hypothetical protein